MLTSRSAIVTHKACPRKHFYNYRILGTGIVPGGMALDLEIGTAIHLGLQHLLENHIGTNSLSSNIDSITDSAVEIGTSYWVDVVTRKEIHPKGNEGSDFLILETKALIEALIRVFAIRRLPEFLEEYEILEVEHEEIYPLSPNVTFLGKADGLLLHRQRNILVVLSFKTAAGYLPITFAQSLHDMQGMSECFLVRERIKAYINCLAASKTGDIVTKKDFLLADNGQLPEWFIKLYNGNFFINGVSVNHVQYEHLLKGQYRETSYGSGTYSRQSFLVHPYKFSDEISSDFRNFIGGEENLGKRISGNDELVLSYANFKWKASPGRQPKGWTKINIWEEMPVKEWIGILAQNLIQPEEGDALRNCLEVSEIIQRQNSELERWKRGTANREEKVFHSLTRIKSTEQGQIEAALDEEFELNEASCHNFYGGDCPYLDLCWNGATVEMTLASGKYQVREPHHDLEREEFKSNGIGEEKNETN